MKKASILIVDDEQSIIEFLQYNLLKEGYKVYSANNGQEAVEIVKNNTIDLIILDLMMPVMDGIETCYQIRNEKLKTQPIIAFLTSRSEDYSQIAGFDAGADDYISKPIRPRLLISKIEALLRRLKGNEESYTSQISNHIKINREKFIVEKENKSLFLPKKEFELLEFLMEKPGKVFTRDEILTEVWGDETIVGERTIDVHIRKLREKLGNEFIKTIKGVGYTFSDGKV
ncbi:MAG: response regulator transcription factor [Flavobacteriia bacterium]|nr:response regulator transcription factor [Flavobacteriia bacterium]